MVRFEWDEKKNQSNFVKHGIDFQTAQLIFDDPGCVTFIQRRRTAMARDRFRGWIDSAGCRAYLSRCGNRRIHPHHLSTTSDSPRKEAL
jgi:uncharacterized protein